MGARPERRKRVRQRAVRSGRGHRPGPAPRLPRPRRAPDSPPAGASRPPVGALAFCCSRTCWSTGHCRTRAGETRVAFPVPARRGESTGTAAMAGAIAPATAPHWSLTSRGPKPPASARPAPGGRFPPAGSGAGLRCSWTCRSAGGRPARAGETRVAFP